MAVAHPVFGTTIEDDSSEDEHGDMPMGASSAAHGLGGADLEPSHISGKDSDSSSMWGDHIGGFGDGASAVVGSEGGAPLEANVPWQGDGLGGGGHNGSVRGGGADGHDDNGVGRLGDLGDHGDDLADLSRSGDALLSSFHGSGFSNMLRARSPLRDSAHLQHPADPFVDDSKLEEGEPSWVAPVDSPRGQAGVPKGQTEPWDAPTDSEGDDDSNSGRGGDAAPHLPVAGISTVASGRRSHSRSPSPVVSSHPADHWDASAGAVVEGAEGPGRGGPGWGSDPSPAAPSPQLPLNAPATGPDLDWGQGLHLASAGHASPASDASRAPQRAGAHSPVTGTGAALLDLAPFGLDVRKGSSPVSEDPLDRVSGYQLLCSRQRGRILSRLATLGQGSSASEPDPELAVQEWFPSTDAVTAVIPQLLAMLDPSNLTVIRYLPAKDPGEGDVCAPEGPAGVCDIVQGICSVLLLPFTTPVTSEVLGAPEPTPSLAAGKERGRYVAQGVVSAPVPSLLATVQHTLFRVAAVSLVLSAMDAVCDDDDGASDDYSHGAGGRRMCACSRAASALCAVLVRLVTSSRLFAKQFDESKGLDTLESCGVFDLDRFPVTVATQAMDIVSRLALLGREFYPSIDQSGIVRSMARLMKHTASYSLRGLFCKTVGNLCRHSNHFYPAVAALVYELVRSCSDADPGTRKYASCAVGNAAFHSEDLLGTLEGAIPALVALLRDTSDKTRANAAGALGNFGRHGGQYCAALLSHGCLEGLVEVVVHDTALAPKRVALFSLGTLMAYRPFRAAAVALVPSLSTRISDWRAAFHSIPSLLQFLDRLEDKCMQRPSQ